MKVYLVFVLSSVLVSLIWIWRITHPNKKKSPSMKEKAMAEIIDTLQSKLNALSKEKKK